MDKLKAMQDAGDFTGVLALQEEIKCLPWGLVWDEYLKEEDCTAEDAWYQEVKNMKKKYY